jgi:hypothetical protein
MVQVFDKHNRGYISASDLRAVLQCLGEDLSEEESKYNTAHSILHCLTCTVRLRNFSFNCFPHLKCCVCCVFVIQCSLTIKQYTYQANVDTYYFISYTLRDLVLTEPSSYNGMYIYLVSAFCSWLRNMLSSRYTKHAKYFSNKATN